MPIWPVRRGTVIRKFKNTKGTFLKTQANQSLAEIESRLNDAFSKTERSPGWLSVPARKKERLPARLYYVLWYIFGFVLIIPGVIVASICGNKKPQKSRAIMHGVYSGIVARAMVWAAGFRLPIP